jgi:PST family polysaccharide transporter
MGLVFMWNGLMVSAVTYLTVTLITKQAGLRAVGLYSAAFALSGIFVNFVLAAMSADYYPRLTGAADDKAALNRLVNEQTEIGLLLAVPGLLATLALSHWIIQLFYSHEFSPAVKLLQWFILGCLGRVISWPLGFIMLALGKRRWYFTTETSANVIHILLIALGLFALGIQGVAIAFFVMNIGYALGVYLVARHLTAFSWSTSSRTIAGFALLALAATFIAAMLLPLWPATILGMLVTIVASAHSLRQLVLRLSPQHPAVRVACRIPGIRTLCGL